MLALGKSYVRKESGREEVAEVIAEFEDDTFASISLSWLYSGAKHRLITINGDSGTIEVDALAQRVTIYRRRETTTLPVQANNTIESMITHFIDCITKKTSPQNSALVGAVTVGVLSAMKESMRTKRFVSVLGS